VDDVIPTFPLTSLDDVMFSRDAPTPRIATSNDARLPRDTAELNKPLRDVTKHEDEMAEDEETGREEEDETTEEEEAVEEADEQCEEDEDEEEDDKEGEGEKEERDLDGDLDLDVEEAREGNAEDI